MWCTFKDSWYKFMNEHNLHLEINLKVHQEFP